MHLVRPDWSNLDCRVVMRASPDEGEQSEDKEMAVAPVATEPASLPWSARIGSVTDLPVEGGSNVVEVDGRTIALYRVDGNLYAVDDICTHAASSLSREGERCGLVVECALHRARFSLETGQALVGPTRKPLRRYHLEVRGDDVVATQGELASMRRTASR